MSNLSFNIPDKSRLTLSEITDKINSNGTKGEYDKKSLRLHTSGNDTRLKVHTTKSKLLGFVGGKERTKARTEARETVRDAIMREFGCTQTVADDLMTKVCKKSDRVSLGDLQKLKNEAFSNTGSPTKKGEVNELTKDQVFSLSNISLLRGHLETLMRLLVPMPEKKTDIENVTRLLEKIQTSFGKEDPGSVLNQVEIRSFPTLRSVLEQSKSVDLKTANMAVEKLEVLTKAYGGLTSYGAPEEWTPFKNNISYKLTKVFNSSLAELRQEASSSQNKLVSKQVGEIIQINGKQVSEKWEKKTDSYSQTDSKLVEKFKEKSFTDLINLGTDSWKPASSGATGALIIRNKELPGEGIILKMDAPRNAKASKMTSDYLHKVTSGLRQEGVNLPVSGMAVKRLDETTPFDEKMIDLYEHKLGDMKIKGEKVGTNEKNLGFLKSGDRVPVSVMMVPGCTDLNRLETSDKVLLVKGDKLPRNLGHAMILGRMFGCGDHLGIGQVEGKHATGLTNFGNLMFNKKDGGLTFIDYAAFNSRPHEDNANDVRLESKDIVDAFKDLLATALDFVPGKIDSTMERFIVNPYDSKGLSSVLDCAFRPGTFANGGLFDNSEAGALEHVTFYDKSRFIANLMLGAIEGLQTVVTHSDLFLLNEEESTFKDPENTLKEVKKVFTDFTERHNVKIEDLVNSLRQFLEKNPSKID